MDGGLRNRCLYLEIRTRPEPSRRRRRAAGSCRVLVDRTSYRMSARGKDNGHVRQARSLATGCADGLADFRHHHARASVRGLIDDLDTWDRDRSLGYVRQSLFTRSRCHLRNLRTSAHRRALVLREYARPVLGCDSVSREWLCRHFVKLAARKRARGVSRHLALRDGRDGDHGDPWGGCLRCIPRRMVRPSAASIFRQRRSQALAARSFSRFKWRPHSRRKCDGSDSVRTVLTLTMGPWFMDVAHDRRERSLQWLRPQMENERPSGPR